MKWVKLFDNHNLEVQTKVLPTKGNLVYEYNPFRNYRIDKNMYEYKGQLYSLGDLWELFLISLMCKIEITKVNNVSLYTITSSSNTKDAEHFGETVKEIYSSKRYLDIKNLEKALKKCKDIKDWHNVPDTETDPYLREAGELCDFITDELSFSLDHPVHIIPQHSYDGSVNLIINDGLNTPRLINSRFSATGRNTYEIVDRKGNNDTNIYDLGEQFDIDTSLYKRVIKIPKIDFKGVSSGGNLKVGNYHFYFKLSDADGNETDFVGESGLVSVFIGFNDYFSVTTGLKNENSFKCVNFQISNIDSSYDYVTVYYSRSTAEGLDNSIVEYVKIDKKYPINNASNCNINITGYENYINISNTDINLNYNIVDNAYTSAVCQNMLFLGNVHRPDIPYVELSDLSLRFLPYLKEELYTPDIDHNYSMSTSPDLSYIDPKFIYNKTGYWGNEIYRFGIVYIMRNGDLSPVFNVRGNKDVGTFNDGEYTQIPIIKDGSRNYISYNEETFIVNNNSTGLFENVKGVVSFAPNKDTSTIYSVDFRVDDATIQELKKLVKGYFFVRQTRIPTILAQGITIGIDKESRTPTIPTTDGFLHDLAGSLSKTHVTTEDINDVNYVSEGFLSRYSFKFEKKSSSLWGKIAKITAIGIGVVALAAATVCSGGLAGVATGALAGFAANGVTMAGLTVVALAAMTAVGTALTSSLVMGTAIAAGAAVATTAVAATILEVRYGIASINPKKKLDGRNTKAPAGYKIVESEDSRKLSLNFTDRIIIKDASNNLTQGIICPDYELNQAYYNQIFTGNTHLIELAKSLNINSINGLSSNYFNNDDRHFYVPAYLDREALTSHSFKIVGVPDNTKCVGIDSIKFRSRAGEAEEAWRYECIADDYKSDVAKVKNEEDKETQSNKQINTDIIRGSFGAYLAFNDDKNRFSPAETVNIYIPEYSKANMSEYFYLRMIDSSVFSAITDRFDLADIDDKLVNRSNIVNNEPKQYSINAYRGDCYLCQFTHRVVRNFNDPSAPYNDEIVDENTWKDNYDPSDPEKYEQINLGDINAILIGMWITFKVRSSNNLNIRTLDGSYVDESAMIGHPRGYFPYHPMSVEGVYKTPESQVLNKGFSKSVSERWNFEVPDVPHIKNWFKTRIMYSDIHINDAYKNGFRVFLGTNYRDYTREYGEIVKLVPFESSLLCVFEHGVALIPVNERAVAGQGAGGNVYINTSNVLPENPKIISDMFGSQWPESILKVPGRTGDAPLYVYGVDTIAKKIWRTDGNTLECISDFKVQEFLNNNITLGERELTPKIGIRNVKTHYNAFKRDVMFTFYDNTYGFEEKVWNLCWNELLQKFITFYSWVPSYMENINNIPFSFDRNTSKWIAKLGTSHSDNSFADGITLSNNIITATPKTEISAKGTKYYKIETNLVEDFTYQYSYINKSGELITKKRTIPENPNFIGVLSLSNRTLPDDLVFYNIDYNIEHDIYGNHRNFYTDIIDTITLGEGDTYDAKFTGKTLRVWGLFFKPESNPAELYSELYYRNSENIIYSDSNESHKLVPDTNIVMYKQGILLQYGVNIWGNVLPTENPNWLNEIFSSFSDDTIVGVTSILNGKLVFLPCDATSFSGKHYTIRDVRRELKRGTAVYSDKTIDNGYSVHGGSNTALDRHYIVTGLAGIHFDKCIFKNSEGKREVLPEELLVNSKNLVTLLNIKASIKIIEDSDNIKDYSDWLYNKQAQYEGTTIDMGYYETTIAITTKWNLQFLSTDFWRHGQAGIFDITEPVKPTHWYGKRHPFEFEVVVANDPGVHKIFDNLELVANKAKPESFHYEIVGECYDFAKDKPNMYFRLEALKAIWQYNGADICYNRDFIKTKVNQQPRSADLPHKYYTRKDTINEIEDYYISFTSINPDYRHLSGSELVHYPTRQEYRIWNHAKAIDLNDLRLDDARSLIASNCLYLEDRWKITINPILVCYKNEYIIKPNYVGGFAQLTNSNSDWPDRNKPKLPVYNSPIPDESYEYIKNNNDGNIYMPPELANLGYEPTFNTYDSKGNLLKGYLDDTNWLSESSIYGTTFGEAQNRKEVSMKDRFIKVRIRYSGDELAIIDYLNTLYRVSYT